MFMHFLRYPHLDKDWFSIHPHRRHLCASCGKNFRDTISGIGNPIRATARKLQGCFAAAQKSGKRLSLQQRDIQVVYKSGVPTPRSFVLRKPREKASMCTHKQTVN